MLTLDLESGFPVCLEGNGRLLEEGLVVEPIRLESGYRLLLQSDMAILEEGSAIEPIRLESGYRLLLQSDMAILEEGSVNIIYLNLESGLPLFTESLLRFVA